MFKNFNLGLLNLVVLFTLSQYGYAQCSDVSLESITNPGPYNVATLTESDGLRNGPDYSSATVYYPTNGTPPYASIAIVPGFVSAPSAISAWGPYYASHGIIAIVIGTNNIFEYPETRANALIDALETMRQENTRTSSPLLGKIDTEKFAVSGHSMGGGGAQRAAVLDSNIKAVVALCPWLPNASLSHTTPVLIFSGENDSTAPPSQHANIHYNATPENTSKLLYEVNNGNHSVANTPNGAQGNVGKLAISWLRLQLDDNSCYCPLIIDELLDSPATASKFDTNVSCQTLSISDVNNSEKFLTTIYPNPTSSFVMVESNFTVDKKYEVFSLLGARVMSGSIKSNKERIDLTELNPNVYVLKIAGQSIKILKQ